MILSRTLRMEDYDELKVEVSYVDKIQLVCGPPHGGQHTHRRWEYALALRALKEWRTSRADWCSDENLKIADFGCGIGLWSPMCLALGHHVSMFEVWVYGNEETYAQMQMAKVMDAFPIVGQGWEMIHRPLCELVAEDKGRFDAAFCISTLEHIGEYQRAFRDLCDSVKPGGLLFMTTDFADTPGHTTTSGQMYTCHWMRPQGMWTVERYKELISLGEERGFSLFGIEWPGTMLVKRFDYPFTEAHRIVSNHGFASLVLRKNNG
jgi:SAM-dependent methyltransferase